MLLLEEFNLFKISKNTNNVSLASQQVPAITNQIACHQSAQALSVSLLNLY
jgi:conjugal transfer/entry exclusion protein